MKGDGLFREGADVRFAFIDAEKTKYPIKRLCKILEVSESGCHAWIKRPESTRAKENRKLAVCIKSEFERSRKTYGSPRIKVELDAQGVPVGKHRVARIMKEVGIKASPPKRFKATTISKHKLNRAPNLVERRFNEFGTAPNRLWVSDITYVWTYQGCIFAFSLMPFQERSWVTQLKIRWRLQWSMTL